MRRKWLILLLTLCFSVFIVVGCGDSSNTDSSYTTTSGSSESLESSDGATSDGDSESVSAPDSGDSSLDSTSDEQPQSKTVLIRDRLNVDPVEGSDNLVWGEMPDQMITDSATLNTFAFTLTDKYEVAFRGWTTTKGSATVEYADGATYTVSETGEIVILYAIVELVWIG